MEINELLNEIVDWLNENYNQNSDNYCIISGPKQEVIKYNENTAISFWGCGAIVCHESLLYFISEDDGHWFINSEGKYNIGLQSCFSIEWAQEFANALTRLIKYTEEHGKPVYYSGTNVLCNYTL